MRTALLPVFSLALLAIAGPPAPVSASAPADQPPGDTSEEAPAEDAGEPPSAGESFPPPPDQADGDTSDTSTGDAAEDDTARRREVEFRTHLARAQRAERERQWSEAEREYQAALEIEPFVPEALRGRSHARFRKTRKGRCPRMAVEDLWLLQIYDPRGLWLTERRYVLDWTGSCGELYAAERLRLAEELAALPVGRLGRPDEVAGLAARLRLEEAKAAKLEQQAKAHLGAARRHVDRYRKDRTELKRQPTVEDLRLAAEIYRLSDMLKEALAVYEELGRLHPDERGGKNAEDELRIELRVRELGAAQGGRPTPEAEADYNRGVEHLTAGDLERARERLSRAIEASPWFPQAYYRVGQVYARSGELNQAIEAFTTAIAMDGNDHASHMALGLLYYKRFRGAHDERARHHLTRALRLRPDLHDLNYYLGELCARTGDRESARQHFRKFIEQSPIDDPYLRVAKDALRDLEMDTQAVARQAPPPPPPDQLRRLDPALQKLINEAYVSAEFGDLDRAKQGLLSARETYSQEPALLNALAEVVFVQGQIEEATGYWLQSLELDQDQMLVHERLGLSFPDSDQALKHLGRAAELGSGTARFNLARRLWDDWQVFAASEQLDLYLLQAGAYDLNWDRAERFRERIDQFLFRLYAVLGSLFGLGLGFGLWRIYKRLRGASLAQFLQQEPKSFPEVARILSLIRHEILKHNTAFLTDVGQALELEEADADTRAMLLARRLFGDDQEDTARGKRGTKLAGRAGRRGTYGRFLGYVADLEKVARSYGVNLNLFRKDPTFRAMSRAFEQVARDSDRLRAPYALSSGERLELARQLARSGDVLGRRAFEQLSGTIQSLCIVDVTPRIFIEVLRQVASEDQFDTLEIAPLIVRGKGARIRVFRTDLEDILTNVLRNSLRSSALYAPSPIALAVDLVTEVDDITGLTTLAIRIKDHSTERLTNEMVRGRYVERGMGITADLLSRYDASIAVEPEPEWAKAVVLRFFTVEETVD